MKYFSYINNFEDRESNFEENNRDNSSNNKDIDHLNQPGEGVSLITFPYLRTEASATSDLKGLMIIINIKISFVL